MRRFSAIGQFMQVWMSFLIQPAPGQFAPRIEFGPVPEPLPMPSEEGTIGYSDPTDIEGT